LNKLLKEDKYYSSFDYDGQLKKILFPEAPSSVLRYVYRTSYEAPSLQSFDFTTPHPPILLAPFVHNFLSLPQVDTSHFFLPKSES